MSFTQANRQLRISTPLGKDKLLLAGLKGSEALGRLFEYHAELLSDSGDIALENLLGQRVAIELDLADGGKRHINAFVSLFTQIGQTESHFRYHAVLHPWLWFLTLTKDCRIYQNRNTPAILKEVFDENGFNDYELRLSNSYRTREYCVQYRESDFEFVSRLMEEEGIYYYFSHAAGKHTLMLCDDYGSHTPFKLGEIPFQPRAGSGGLRGEETITQWQMSKAVRSGRYAHTDYDFKKPRATLLANAPLKRTHPHAEYEVFDYPGIYEVAGDGEGYARNRIEELQSRHERLGGESNARQIAVGGLFTLDDHPRQDQNREYLITGTVIELHSDNYGTGIAGKGDEIYRCDFTCIDSQESYRSERITSKPLVKGPQTAVVVGRAGEEIYTDEYGRIKVQFHWDRYGESNENSSCWVRVAQPWAGNNWGAMSIPRIGQEVIVEFLEGDPDRPIITGSVYNAEQMPPWGLPANQTQSGILSRSTKGGSQANANALRFEDKKGEEQLWLHAEKDQLTEVENDETKWVGNDRQKTIDGNETTIVHKNRTETVDQNETVTVHQNRTETVDQNETITIGGNRSVTISGNKTETITLGKAESILLGKALTIGGLYQTTVGAAMNTTVTLGQAEQVGHSKYVKVGKHITLDAGDSITLKTGDSVLVMKSDGTVTLNGADISVKATCEINNTAKGDIVMKGKNIKKNN
jgi:type VI secretion system secreted protein VgrG